MIHRDFTFLPPGVLLIDVRDPAEYQKFHLPSALLIPVYQLGELVPRIIPDVNTPLFLYCDHGTKSRAAAIQLTDMGYRRVYDAGGLGS